MRRRFTSNYSKRDDKPGDVMLINGAGKVVIVHPENMLNSINRGYTPYGVVVVPSSHDVYGDGTMGVMSLKNTGYIPFGPYGHDAIFDHLPFTEWVLNDKGKMPLFDNVGPIPKGSGETIYCPLSFSKRNIQSVIVATDYIKNGNPSCNPEFQYNNFSRDSDFSIAPNIYNEDGSMNPLCKTERNWALFDYKGFENTKHIYDAYGSQWSNRYNDNYAYHELINVKQGEYPLIEKAVNFDIKGRWYVPSIGEFQYIVSRYKKIQETLALISQHTECELILDSYFDSTIVNTKYHKKTETNANDRDRCSGFWFDPGQKNSNVPEDYSFCSFGDDKNRAHRGRFMCRFSYKSGFKSMS